MKKVLMLVLAVCIGIAFVATVFAQTTTEKAGKAATEAVKDKGKAAVEEKATQAVTEKTAPVPAPEKKAEKIKKQLFKGEVTAMDTAAKTLTVKNDKGEKTFDVTGAKMKSEPKTGDKVVVKYAEKEGKLVARTVAKKGDWKAKKKDKKPAETPAVPEKATAPAPAPAK